MKKLNSFAALVAGFASVIGMTYETEIHAYVHIHPMLMSAIGFIVVLYNNLVNPIHK